LRVNGEHFLLETRESGRVVAGQEALVAIERVEEMSDGMRNPSRNGCTLNHVVKDGIHSDLKLKKPLPALRLSVLDGIKGQLRVLRQVL
jgi:hypothetical protein